MPQVKSRFGANMTFEKGTPSKITSLFAPHESISKESLLQASHNVINSLPKKQKLEKATVRNVVSLEKTIDTLTERVTTSLRMSFTDFSSKFSQRNSKNNAEVKVNVIVSFLAMLELVKQGIIAVEQDNRYGEIDMHSNSISIPRYE